MAKEMQRLNSSNQEIDLEGHKVFVGSQVNVRWKGEWYDGRVLKLGPKRNLCRIKDLYSKQTLLLEPQQIKPTQAHRLDKRLLPGNHVAYNEGDKWLEGVIMTPSAVGVVQVSWRKSVRAEESQNWFEIADVSPVVQNVSNFERTKEELAASKSGLLPNDAVEPHPRTMQNALFDLNGEDEEERGTDITDHFPRFRRSPKNQNGFPMSPTYEDIDEDTIRRATRSNTRPLPSLPVDQITDSLPDPWMNESMSFSPAHSIPPPALSTVYPHFTPYGSTVWGTGASVAHHQTHPLQSFHIPHPSAASDRNLEKSTLPCALSYQLNYHNGIPPHHSSNFFKQMKRTVALPSQMSRGSQASDSDIYSHSLMRPSPSILSRAMSEPLSTTLQVIPPRERKRNRLFSWKKKKSSKKGKKQKEEPLPYEVPSRILEVVAEDESVKEDWTETEATLVSRPQTSTPKSKSPGAPPVITSSSASLLSVNMGENILITCIAASKAAVTYDWYKDGEKLPGKASHIEQLSPGKLEIRKAQQVDEGMYRCVAKNKHGSQTRYFQLNVTMKYKVQMKIVRRSPHRTKQIQKVKPKPEEPIASETPISDPNPREGLLVSIPGEDVAVKKFLDDIIEDIQIPDVEFAVSKPEEDNPAMEMEIENVPGNQSDHQESLEINPIEDDDQLMDIPKIAGAPERKHKILRRFSIGNSAAGDMDLYLGGYGEDYGSQSSNTDLEQEGLRYYKEREIKKSLAARNKEKERQSKEDSPTDRKKNKESDTAPSATGFKHMSRKLLSFSRFARKRKKTDKVTDEPADGAAQPSQEFTPTKQRPVATVLPQVMIEAAHLNGERDSMAVNTSLGGTGSDDTVVDEEEAGEKGHVRLPLETVRVSDRVRLLQESVKEHHPDDIVAQASRRKGFLSGIFSKGKNPPKTSA